MTEYGSASAVPHPGPFLRPGLVARCATAGVTLSSVGGYPQFCPPCDTTERRDYCEEITRPVAFDVVTFYIHTALRW
jgi:hypothetical protein